MMKALSLHSRNDLAQFLTKSVPQLACDYYLTIESNDGASVEQVLVTSFSFPSSGIQFSAGTLGHISTNIDTANTIQVSFLVPNKGESPMDKLFKAQFKDGVPLFIPLNQLPTVQIRRLFATVLPKIPYTTNPTFLDYVDSEPMITLTGCRFSMPKPDINISSDSFATYNVTISFEDFEI